MPAMFQEILVPVDLSPHSSAALAYALGLREGEKPIARDARVTVVHALDTASVDLGAASEVLDLHANLRRHVVADLGQFVDRHAGSDFRCERRVVDGSAVAAIERLTRELKPHLVVMGTHGRTGLARNILGSVAETAVRRSPVPVLCLKALPDRTAPRPAAIRKVLVPTDGTAHSRAALPFAIAFCRHHDASLAVLRVARDGDEARKLRAKGPLFPESQLERPPAAHLPIGWKVVVKKGPRPPVEWVVHTGPTESWIAAAAEDLGADLICMASHGPHRFPRSLLAGTTEMVVRLATVPVLALTPALVVPRARKAKAEEATAADEVLEVLEEATEPPADAAPETATAPAAEPEATTTPDAAPEPASEPKG